MRLGRHTYVYAVWVFSPLWPAAEVCGLLFVVMSFVLLLVELYVSWFWGEEPFSISTCDSGALWKAIWGVTSAHEQQECILATPQNMQETPAKIAVIVHHLRLLEPKLASPLNLMAWTGLKSISETVLYHRHKRSPPSRAAVDFEPFVPGFGVSGGVVVFFGVCQNKVSTPGILYLGCAHTPDTVIV